jgi:hypothetical protein
MKPTKTATPERRRTLAASAPQSKSKTVIPDYLAVKALTDTKALELEERKWLWEREQREAERERERVKDEREERNSYLGRRMLLCQQYMSEKRKHGLPIEDMENILHMFGV